MFTILRQAFRRTIQNWPIVLLIFIVNFCLGLCLAFPAFNILQTEANQSLAFDNLINDFDFTVLSDFLKKSGKSLRPLLPIGFILTALNAILNVFFSGGILSQFTLRETFQLNDFLRNSAKYFFKFLLIFLIQVIFLIIAIIVSVVLYSVFGAIAYDKIEPVFMAWMIPPTIFMVFYITYLLNVGNYAKVLLHRDALLNPWNAFWKASTYVFTNFKTMYIYWVVLLVSVALLLFYLWLESVTGMTSGFMIWLFFVIQQAFVFGRVFLRTWHLSNAFDFVSLRPIPLTPKPIIIAPIKTEEASEAPETDEDTSATKLSD